MKTILSIVAGLLLSLSVQGEMIIARQLQLLDMRTRQIKPYSGPDYPVYRGAIGHFRYSYNYRTARENRQIRRWRQNYHRRQWMENRRMRRHYRTRRY